MTSHFLLGPPWVEMILDGLIMFPKIDLRFTNKINID